MARRASDAAYDYYEKMIPRVLDDFADPLMDAFGEALSYMDDDWDYLLATGRGQELLKKWQAVYERYSRKEDK